MFLKTRHLRRKKIGSKYLDPISEPYVLSVEAKRPDEVKSLVRQSIINEFWSRNLKRAAKFPGCSQSARTRNSFLRLSVIVSVCHTTAGDKPEENKFAGLPNEVPAPHTNQLQLQFQQLQAQMRQLQWQLQDRPAHTGCMSRNTSPRRNSQVPNPFARARGRFNYQGPNHYNNAPESARQASNRHQAASYRPQYNQRTLALQKNSPTRPSQHVR